MTRSRPAPPPDLQARLRLALSIVQHRRPTEAAWDSVRLALLGATADEILRIEKAAR